MKKERLGGTKIMKKKVIALVACAAMLIGLCGCGTDDSTAANNDGAAVSDSADNNTTDNAADNTADNAADSSADNAASGETVTLNLAYQYGLAYAPIVVAQEQGLIEAAYKEATGGDLEVVWNQMSSGADINTAIVSGELDGGFMGLGPAITGVMKGVGYKIFTNLSGQEHGMMTNDAEVTSLGDLIGSDKQIALVNIGSIQHILLAKALADNGYDAHALDSNIVAMKHPDGMTSLETGSVACHLTSSPYIFEERGEDDLHELTEISETWTVENSFIVGVAAETLYNDDPEIYEALCKGMSDAIDFINDNPEETAEMTCEYDGNTKEEELEYLSKGIYTTETKGIFELAEFMAREEFIDTAPESYEELVFDNVIGD